VHAWDLATALHRSTGELNALVPERGLAFMQDNLTADDRGATFGPAQAPPDEADAHQRIAAFADWSV
jgi:hypothetical protein